MDDGKAQFQAIKTGLLGELSLEVVSGLSGGETIITGPFKALRDAQARRRGEAREARRRTARPRAGLEPA